ncbi:MAG: ABC transporter permease [Gemmatimonadaceae bacterium]
MIHPPTERRPKALDRKLLRDLVHLRSQLGAVALVVACGVAGMVMMRTNYSSLLLSQERFYTRYRFAEVFASLTRAPDALASDIAAISGVSSVQTRTVADVTLDVPGLSEPASGHLVSLPAAGPGALNQVHVREGRRPLPGTRDEVVVSAAFADANGLHPGATLGAVLGGRWHRLRIVGLAISPEFVYVVGGSGLFPDDRRYGVLWMDGEQLAAAMDREHAFNDVTLALAPGARPEPVIAALDRLLAPYGGGGAYDRERQLSHRFLSDEIDQNRAGAILVPAIFLAIAAFLTHLVLGRLVTLQRDQIALLKAFGYSDRAVATHFVLLALAAVVAGAVLGTAVGLWAGHGIASYYTRFFQFPELTFVVPPAVIAAAVLVSALAATMGAAGAARGAARLPPAEAMRPQPPARFRATFIDRSGLQRRLSPAARIVVRNLERRPLQTLFTVLGLAMAVAVVLVGYYSGDAVEYMADVQFRVVQREDVQVGLQTTRGEGARHALARLPGVRRVEPFRAVRTRLHSGALDRQVAILGLETDGRLHALVDADGHRVPLTPGGLVLATSLAELLDVEVGDSVRVAVLEGARPVRDVPVVQTVDELVGMAAYMALPDLDRLAGGPRQLSGAFLSVDPAHADSLHARLKRMPAVNSVTVRASVLEAFDRTVAQNLRVSTGVLTLVAGVLAFGVVYNAARVSLSERGRELASLRVLGFTRREVAVMLLGEQALLTLVALPVGALLGRLLAAAIVAGSQTELFRLPLVISRRTYLISALWILLAALLSGVAVWRRVQRMDLIAVLKSRE